MVSNNVVKLTDLRVVYVFHVDKYIECFSAFHCREINWKLNYYVVILIS
jgi:hypothetical protein